MKTIITLQDYFGKFPDEIKYRLPKFVQVGHMLTSPIKKIIRTGYCSFLSAFVAYYFFNYTNADIMMWPTLFVIFFLALITDLPTLLEYEYSFRYFGNSLVKLNTLMDFYVKLGENKSYSEIKMKKDHPLCKIVTDILSQQMYSESIKIENDDYYSVTFRFIDKDVSLQDLFVILGGNDWHPFSWICNDQFQKFNRYDYIFYGLTFLTLISLIWVRPVVFTLLFFMLIIFELPILLYRNERQDYYKKYSNLKLYLPIVTTPKKDQ
jgi:hypothetical protein